MKVKEYFHAVVVQMGFQLDAYNTTEDSGAAVVCVILTGSIERNVSVTLFTADIDAVGKSYKVIYQFLGVTEKKSSSVYGILAWYANYIAACA